MLGDFKASLKKPSHVTILVFIVFLTFTRLPQVIEHWGLEGEKILGENRLDIQTQKLVPYPPSEGMSLVVFWATWCAPCKLEMNRLKQSVNSGAIPRDRIFAISLFEESKTVSEFLRKNDYPFVFLAPTPSDEKLGIRATPTTMILQGPEIRSLSQGMSLVGIWWAEYLFRHR